MSNSITTPNLNTHGIEIQILLKIIESRLFLPCQMKIQDTDKNTNWDTEGNIQTGLYTNAAIWKWWRPASCLWPSHSSDQDTYIHWPVKMVNTNIFKVKCLYLGLLCLSYKPWHIQQWVSSLLWSLIYVHSLCLLQSPDTFAWGIAPGVPPNLVSTPWLQLFTFFIQSQMNTSPSAI